MSTSDELAIRVEHVSKRFKLYHDPVTGPLKELLCFWDPQRHYRELWALRDVSLNVRRGEVVGVVGPNGAGKTTLLKLIAGLLPLERGTIDVRGKVTALLALGVGVHPELSGRENILHGGMLLGLSRKAVQERLPWIVEFSELGPDVVARPLRTYSAGMRARLLFSISMSIDPDILIVDEALATGDLSFVHKCGRRIREICRSGSTVLFVSHNLRQVEELCQRAIYLHEGQVVLDGSPRAAIDAYLHRARNDAAQKVGGAPLPDAPPRGTGEVRLLDAWFEQGGERTRALAIGEPCRLVLDVQAQAALAPVKLLLELRSEKSAVTFAFTPPALPALRGPACPESFGLPPGRSRISLDLAALPLGDGAYGCDLELFDGSPGHQFSYDTCYCFYPRALEFLAFYRDPALHGRGTLCELPVAALSVEARDG